jgi:hypothetical protein
MDGYLYDLSIGTSNSTDSRRTAELMWRETGSDSVEFN